MPAIHEQLRKFALALPDATESIACAGTSLEAVTVTVRKKAFVFLRATDMRFKLRESLAAAVELAADDPELCDAGANGWVKVSFTANRNVPRAQLERWIGESYRLTGGVMDASKTSKAPRSKSVKSARGRAGGAR